MLENTPTSVSLVIPPLDYAEVTSFLRERSADGREAFAALLCGCHEYDHRARLLTRHVILPEDDCFVQRSCGGIECARAFDAFLLDLAEREGLVLVAMHTHPHEGQPHFSPVDDRAEQDRATALCRSLAGKVSLGSVVFDRSVQFNAARLWKKDANGLAAFPISVCKDLADELGKLPEKADGRYDRQVRAFGTEFQRRLEKVRIGVVGVGGLGAMIVEGLARLGIRDWVLVDPDCVDETNLNRLVGATTWDAVDKSRKVHVARRSIRRIHGHHARVLALTQRFPSRPTVRALSTCHILICATDNEASRFALQEIASVYLRPLVNTGVHLGAKDRTVSRILARIVAPPVGGPWCLVCAGIADSYQASVENMDREHRRMLKQRGYLDNTPRPAVYWLNSVASSYAIRLAHALVMPLGIVDVEQQRDVCLDLVTLETTCIQNAPSPKGCLVCGASSSGLRALGDRFMAHHRVPMTDLNLSAAAEESADPSEPSTPGFHPPDDTARSTLWTPNPQ